MFDEIFFLYFSTPTTQHTVMPLTHCNIWVSAKLFHYFKSRCKGSLTSFSTIFKKGNNFCHFLFAFLEIKALQTMGSTL